MSDLKRLDEIMEKGVTLTEKEWEYFTENVNNHECECPYAGYDQYLMRLMPGPYCPNGKYSCAEVWKAGKIKSENHTKEHRHNYITYADNKKYEDYSCKNCSLSAYNKEKDEYVPGAFCRDKRASCKSVWKSDEIFDAYAKAKAESDAEYDNFEKLVSTIIDTESEEGIRILLNKKMKLLLSKAKAYDEAKEVIEAGGNIDTVKDALTMKQE